MHCFLWCKGLYPRLYPELSEFMGLNLSEDALQQVLSLPFSDQSSGVRVQGVVYAVCVCVNEREREHLQKCMDLLHFVGCECHVSWFVLGECSYNWG